MKKILNLLILIGLLLSYFPTEILSRCSETENAEKWEKGCGFAFHCPMVSERITPLPSNLILLGYAELPNVFKLLDKLPYFFFHPPKWVESRAGR
ncbi:MAG: hypothetical protein N3G78_11140 [Desulfobacterota bacterium]|nr:hypothetical protein [Thermodesulfobacteriota bacterium]